MVKSPPALAGVEHRFLDVGGGVTIHVADAGPSDGPVVMLVHGFPQHWWEWRYVVGPLAAAGYRVLCPDLRGAGWSSAPGGLYRKTDMADDLAAVLTRLGVDKVNLVAHDWGGPVAFLMMLRHPERVAGYFGVNTTSPRLKPDLGTIRHLWRFWYQVPIALPGVGPWLLADPKARYLRTVCGWAGGGYGIPSDELWRYVDQLREPGHAMAGSRWYRTFLTREFGRWMAGEFAGARIRVPVRWLMGTDDPVLTPALLRGYEEWIDDFGVELVDGVGHWFPEQRPELLVDRLRAFLATT